MFESGERSMRIVEIQIWMTINTRVTTVVQVAMPEILAEKWIIAAQCRFQPRFSHYNSIMDKCCPSL